MAPQPVRSNDEVLRRVQGEFMEMPGLRLTEAQARRLWGLDEASCDALLGALVDAKFLFRTRERRVHARRNGDARESDRRTTQDDIRRVKTLQARSSEASRRSAGP